MRSAFVSNRLEFCFDHDLHTQIPGPTGIVSHTASFNSISLRSPSSDWPIKSRCIRRTLLQWVACLGMEGQIMLTHFHSDASDKIGR